MTPEHTISPLSSTKGADPMSGFIVARSSSVVTLAGQTVPTWDLAYSTETKPSARELGQFRAAKSSRNHKIRVFTDEAWDALPLGSRDTDWVYTGSYAVPR